MINVVSKTKTNPKREKKHRYNKIIQSKRERERRREILSLHYRVIAQISTTSHSHRFNSSDYYLLSTDML